MAYRSKCMIEKTNIVNEQKFKKKKKEKFVCLGLSLEISFDYYNVLRL